MAEERFRLTVRIELQTSLHIAGPGRTLPLVDKSVEVDEVGIPLIPASTFRGRLRAQTERLARSLGEMVCQSPRPDRMCPHLKREDYGAIKPQSELPGEDSTQPYFCRACRIFGSAWRLSNLGFTDLRPRGNQWQTTEDQLPARIGVSISRLSQTAEEQRLFAIETVPHQIERAEKDTAKLQFEGRLDGWLDRDDLGLLIAAIRTLTHFGGGKARGTGRVEVAALELDFYEPVAKTWQRRSWQDLLKEVKFGETT